MAWVVQQRGGNGVGLVHDNMRTFVMSNAALTAGTYDLGALINTALGLNTVPASNNTGAPLIPGSDHFQFAVISFVSTCATAGNATFNTADADVKRQIPLVVGEVTRKAENSPYWWARVKSALILTTDVTIANLQIIVGLF